jgi:microcystin-dependent protein
MSEPFLGEIRMFAGDFNPKAWALCNGQLLAIAQNQALFSLLGTTYGGNGVTTFALPDLRGRLPMHFGNGQGLSNYTLGQRTGTEAVTLTAAQIPAHAHNLTPSCNNDVANTDSQSPVGAFPAVQDGNAGGFAMYATTAQGNSKMLQTPTGSTGGNQPHDNRQPSLVLTFIICIQGLFPSRN